MWFVQKYEILYTDEDGSSVGATLFGPVSNGAFENALQAQQLIKIY